jgi:hypothetical protein
LVNNYDVPESDAARGDKRPFNGAIGQQRPYHEVADSGRSIGVLDQMQSYALPDNR